MTNSLDRRVEAWRTGPCPHCGKPLPSEPPHLCGCEGAREERTRWDAQLRQVKEALAEEQIKQRKERAGLVGRWHRATFETFDERWQPEAYQKAKEFTGDNGENLILCGARYGTGKTHLAVAILHRHIEQGGTGIFCEVPALLRRLRSTFSPDAKESEGKVFTEIQKAGLLVLDDLGKEKWSRWVEEILYDIVNYRWVRELPTVITTNLLPEELGGAIGLGCVSRLRQWGISLELKGEDYRLRGMRRNG